MGDEGNTSDRSAGGDASFVVRESSGDLTENLVEIKRFFAHNKERKYHAKKAPTDAVEGLLDQVIKQHAEMDGRLRASIVAMEDMKTQLEEKHVLFEQEQTARLKAEAALEGSGGQPPRAVKVVQLASLELKLDSHARKLKATMEKAVAKQEHQLAKAVEKLGLQTKQSFASVAARPAAPAAPAAARPSLASRLAPAPGTAPFEPRAMRAPAPNRVIVRTSKLTQGHPLRSPTLDTADVLFKLQTLRDLMGVTVQAVQRMPSGDLAITVKTPTEAKKLQQNNVQWVRQAFEFFSPELPYVADPNYSKTHMVVVHRVSTALSIQRIKEDVEYYGDVRVHDMAWLVGHKRRAGRAFSSLRVKLVGDDDAARMLAARVIGIGNLACPVVVYQAREQVLQCERCQAFMHNAHQCRAPRPKCRRCGANHLTENHPACNSCSAAGHCLHQRLSCANCQQAHLASSRFCARHPAQQLHD